MFTFEFFHSIQSMCAFYCYHNGKELNFKLFCWARELVIEFVNWDAIEFLKIEGKSFEFCCIFYKCFFRVSFPINFCFLLHFHFVWCFISTSFHVSFLPGFKFHSTFFLVSFLIRSLFHFHFVFYFIFPTFKINFQKNFFGIFFKKIRN